MYDIVTHVPIYVYGIFFLLIYLGYQRRFSRTMRVERLAIFPILFLIISLRVLMEFFSQVQISYEAWLLMGMVGMIAGYLQVKNQKIRADHDCKLIHVPGDKSFLFLLMGIFFVEFFIRYHIAIHSVLSQSLRFNILAPGALVFFVGMSLGRNLTYAVYYTKTLSEKLN